MKKTEALKKSLIKESFILGGCIGLAAALFITVLTIGEALERKVAKITSEIISITKEASTTEKKSAEIVQSFKIYSNLPPNKLLSGLNDTASRIRTARPIIDELRVRYKFSDINVNFSKVTEATKRLDVNLLNAYHNQITINYKALTDEIVLSFCDSLIKELPGYVNLEYVEVNRENEISPDVLRAIGKPKSELPYLVSGKMLFNWWTLKESEKSG